MACCVNRGAEEHAADCGVVPVRAAGRPEDQSPDSLHGGDECLQFFDCIEYDDSEEHFTQQRPKPRLLEMWLNLSRQRLAGVTQGSSERPRNRLVEMWMNRRQRRAAIELELRQLQDSLRHLPQDATACLDCAPCIGRFDMESQAFTRANILNVTRAVRQTWEDRQVRGMDAVLVSKLEEGFPELEEWTREEVVRRMLRAACGSERDAAQTLRKAIECRVRERELFKSMSCEVACDMRVVGRDVDQRPALYVCARSQEHPLKDLRSQIFLAFEEATKLAGSEDGQVVFIADMTGFSASLNMDPFVLKNLAENFGSVFADRLHSVLIVDFSLLAQTVWATCKPLLSERTRKKINFVGERAARRIAEERFDAVTCERILSAFAVNRKKMSTAEERFLQAQRTALTEVPLGRPAADKAG